MLRDKIEGLYHYILPRALGNKRLTTIPNESILFFLHSLNPLWILESLGHSTGFTERGKYGGEVISQVGFGDEIFRASFACDEGLVGERG